MFKAFGSYPASEAELAGVAAKKNPEILVTEPSPPLSLSRRSSTRSFSRSVSELDQKAIREAVASTSYEDVTKENFKMKAWFL